eukprot:TRINITY_DN10414_c0_g1_i1.p1 TRINITY_DN10414_c0_g1~~TRINITY_DN10414_c0_g1_i1.p1  ORF type:complete len:186 (-),score=6.00 TRINITY_DN10414_c0_g1_i1:76-633(-)
MLGDMTITDDGKIRVVQKQPQHIVNKYNILSKFCTQCKKPCYQEMYDYRTKKWYNCWRVETRSLFKHIEKQFYTKKIIGKSRLQKDVPKYLGQMLISPLAISDLIQDDGFLSEGAVLISSQGFKFGDCLESQQLIQNVLKKNFGLEASVQASGRIRILAKSYGKLDKLVRHLMLPIFVERKLRRI